MGTLCNSQGLTVNSSCRTCLKNISETETNLNIFATPGLPEKICACSSLSIHPGDGLPISLCASCFKKIDDFYKFQQECIAAQEKFLEYVSKDIKPSLTEIDLNQSVESGLPPPFAIVKQENYENDNAPSTSFLALHKVETELNDSAESRPIYITNSMEITTRSMKRVNFVCEICSKPFMLKTTFDVHMRKHRGLKAFPCSFCDLAYNRRIDLRKHMKYKHKEPIDAKFVCTEEYCDRLFTSKKCVLDHLKDKHGIDAKQRPKQPFTCKECGIIQSSIGVLIQHLAEHRAQREIELNDPNFKKTYPCQFCDRVFNRVDKRRRHSRLIHEGLKEFQCSFCHKLFSRASHKKRHEMIHTGEKPYQCTACHKRFIQKVCLQTHKCPLQTTLCNVEQKPKPNKSKK
ncbi:zinc finger protein with KRAB and SCAN domains 7-like [Eupeodes corollae]|uniref:zinc finger protein with KRAB and SCAN domains 7-like n=1 Tax=Eupeodes corollae TaxID=290404 RepID=UPI0024937BC9|nr:zinc finger protein with KRAB and SCAN domains 7-like [Eupeodes corollae]